MVSWSEVGCSVGKEQGEEEYQYYYCKVAEQKRMCNAMEGMRSKRLGCNIGNVEFGSIMAKTDKASSNSFADTQYRACEMFLLDLG